MRVHIDIPSDTKEQDSDSTCRKPIADNTCFHFIRRHSLFDSWLGSYDSYHPIVDIGCAQGQHVLDALNENQNVRLIACDPVKGNVTELLQQAHRVGVENRLKAAVGSLPRLPRELLGDSSVSSVLCSETLPFVGPDDLERSMRAFHDILVVNGHLHLSLVSDTAAFLQICEMLPRGLEQFGHWIEHKCFATNVQNMARMDQVSAAVVANKGDFEESMYDDTEVSEAVDNIDFKGPPMSMYIYSLSYIRSVLIESGFAIISAKLSPFPDYPMKVSNGKDRMLIVASKLSDEGMRA